MSFGSLAARMLGNELTGKGVIRAGDFSRIIFIK